MKYFVKFGATEEKANEVCNCLRKASADGGFQPTKRIRNSKMASEIITPEDRLVVQRKVLEAEPLAPFTLRLQWNVELDSPEI